MDNFTGLNSELAETQIDNFARETLKLFGDYNAATNFFIYYLGVNWSSPKAIDFYNKYGPKMWAIRENFNILRSKIAIDAVDAFNDMASANDISVIEIPFSVNPNVGEYVDESDYTPSEYFDFNPLREIVSNPYKESNDGKVGMNIEKVKVIYEIFQEKMKTFISALSNISTDFALYDPDGSIQASYKSRINKMVETISDTVTEMYKEIDSALETEQNIIIAAVQQANDMLRG